MYSQEPDIFELALPENVKDISIIPFESEWGVTDELLCYYQNILIGRVAKKVEQRYAPDQKTILIYLFPKLDRKRNYAFPTIPEFLSSITILLNENPIWNLRFEYDCGQYPVTVIQDSLPETIRNLESALLYSAGKMQECPTFNATRSHL